MTLCNHATSRHTLHRTQPFHSTHSPECSSFPAGTTMPKPSFQLDDYDHLCHIQGTHSTHSCRHSYFLRNPLCPRPPYPQSDSCHIQRTRNMRPPSCPAGTYIHIIHISIATVHLTSSSYIYIYIYIYLYTHIYIHMAI